MKEHCLISELDLDRAFADNLVTSPEFFKWVVEQTKFNGLSGELLLLNAEQAKAKPRKKPENWWRHWWCKLDDGKDSETDIFLVLGFLNSEKRLAIHIEDKPPHGKFTPNQYLNYQKRAKFMANKTQFMNYSDYTTILLAPNSFLKRNSDKTHYFDCLLSYESVSRFIPLFGRSLEAAK